VLTEYLLSERANAVDELLYKTDLSAEGVGIIKGKCRIIDALLNLPKEIMEVKIKNEFKK
jgi:hypothetical protein